VVWKKVNQAFDPFLSLCRRTLCRLVFTAVLFQRNRPAEVVFVCLTVDFSNRRSYFGVVNSFIPPLGDSFSYIRLGTSEKIRIPASLDFIPSGGWSFYGYSFFQAVLPIRHVDPVVFYSVAFDQRIHEGKRRYKED
jgi:hypothetical protein